MSTAYSEAGGVSRKEDIVIVGAGIAGLATAVSLQRLIFFKLQLILLDSGLVFLTGFSNAMFVCCLSVEWVMIGWALGQWCWNRLSL